MAREQNNRGRRERDEAPEFADRLVAINRVSKTVKGGKRFGFAALVVVGDQKGRVGFGKGKAKEVPEAIRKATEQAKRQMIRVPLREGRTLHHDMEGRHGAGKVVMRTAPRVLVLLPVVQCVLCSKCLVFRMWLPSPLDHKTPIT